MFSASFVASSPLPFESESLSQARGIRGARLLQPEGGKGAGGRRRTSPLFRVHGNIRSWLWVAESDASAEVDTSLQPGDEPSPVAVFLWGAIFLSSKRTPRPSEQWRVAASAYGSLTRTIVPSLDGICWNLMTTPPRVRAACR